MGLGEFLQIIEAERTSFSDPLIRPADVPDARGVQERLLRLEGRATLKVEPRERRPHLINGFTPRFLVLFLVLQSQRWLRRVRG